VYTLFLLVFEVQSLAYFCGFYVGRQAGNGQTSNRRKSEASNLVGRGEELITFFYLQIFWDKTLSET